MRLKKVLSILLAMAMMLSLSAVAFAEGEDVTPANVAKIGDTEYPTLKEAIAAANDGDTIVLLADSEGWLTIQKDITLDLGGHTLSTDGKLNLWIENADVTIKNGKIVSTNLDGSDVNIGGAAIQLMAGGSVTIAADVTVEATGTDAYGIVCGSVWNGKVQIDGTLKGSKGLTVNGDNANAANQIVVSDGAKIDVTGIALYLAGNAKTTIGAAIIKGETGVEIRAGELEVNGADITATGDFSEAPNGNGSTMTGVAIAVSQHTTNQDIKVTVNDVKATGAKALYEKDMQDGTATGVTLDVQGGDFKGDVAVNTAAEKKVISGGTFDGEVSKELIAAGAAAGTVTKADDSTTTVIGTSAAVAEAIKNAVEAGSTVDILAGDVELDGIPGNVTVKNSGDGAVKVNGDEVNKGEEVTVPTDNSALDTLIKNAEKLLNNTLESADGTDVLTTKKWATAENRQALADAIAAAKAVLANTDATQAELDAAKDALQAAVTTFEGQVAAGTKAVDGVVNNGNGSAWWNGSTATIISGSSGDKGNVNTGANAGMAVAAAFVVVSLAAAGAAAWKKHK